MKVQLAINDDVDDGDSELPGNKSKCLSLASELLFLFLIYSSGFLDVGDLKLGLNQGGRGVALRVVMMMMMMIE